MKTEYPLLDQLPPEIRLTRLLDDLWQETWVSILPSFVEAALTVVSLNQLHGKQLTDTVDALEKNIWSLWDSLIRIKESPVWSSLFDATEVSLDSYSKLHSGCCPQPPFRSLLKYAYPPAAIFDLNITSMRQFVLIHMYVPAQQAGCHIEILDQEIERFGIHHRAYDMCRIFAAIEEAFENYPGALMPCFYPILMAGFSCTSELREWFWHKLAHFEELGSTFIEPCKRQLAIFWGMPELTTRGFVAMKRIGPLENAREGLDSEALDEAGKVALQEPPGRPPVTEQEEIDLHESP